MFEALRGLRDAATLDGETNMDSLVVNNVTNPNKSSDLQQQQDSELVEKLVNAVFEKSYAIDEMLDNNHTTPNNIKIPPLYTNRTKVQQMEHIEKLVEENNLVIQELHAVVQETMQQRNICRQYIIDNSETALLPVQHDRDDHA
jgi:NurA-like 5'-3' nuclease